MRTFALACIAAAVAHAQEEENSIFDTTTVDMKEEATSEDGKSLAALNTVQSLVNMFCKDESDSDHDESDSDHDEKHDMDDDTMKNTTATSTEEMEKQFNEWSKDGEHHSKKKDKHFCHQAKEMLNELNDYHMGDEHHKKHKAEMWGGKMHDAAWDLFGMDGAISVTTYGAAVLTAATTLFF